MTPKESMQSHVQVQIGPSALVGMSLFVILTPLQTWFMKLSFKVRQSSMVSIYANYIRVYLCIETSLALRNGQMEGRNCYRSFYRQWQS